jgi:amino acid permease
MKKNIFSRFFNSNKTRASFFRILSVLFLNANSLEFKFKNDFNIQLILVFSFCLFSWGVEEIVSAINKEK